MKVLIVIPSRYGSTRFPGKPLALIAGQSMLTWVTKVAQKAIKQTDDKVQCDIVIATEDERILKHAEQIGVPCLLTSDSCKTGTDRTWAAYKQLGKEYDAVINLQGDAPLTPPHFLTAIINAFADGQADMATPVLQLSWKELDNLRTNKKTTPFSGTTAILNKQGYALWFSKQIIPAIRNEAKLRASSTYSPVHRHLGLYGYTPKTLEQYVDMSSGHYEEIEGLEQLRLLENGFRIRAVVVEHGGIPCFTGVDSPEDLERVEAILNDAN